MARNSKPRTARGRRVRVVVLAVGIPVLVVVVVAGLFFAYLGAMFPPDDSVSTNSAYRTVAPIAGSLTSVGGTKICDNGDGGHTGLNNTPWYAVYYLVPDESSAQAVLLRTAAAAGLPLTVEKPDPNNPHTQVFDSDPPSGDYGLSLVTLQDRVFSPGDCNSAPNEKIRLSGSRAVFEITFYGKPNK